MKKRLYLTKKRKQRLHDEISINELLYRTFEQMEQHLHDHARHLEKTYKKVIQVRRKDIKNGIMLIEPIIDIQKIDGEGLIITVI